MSVDLLKTPLVNIPSPFLRCGTITTSNSLTDAKYILSDNRITPNTVMILTPQNTTNVAYYYPEMGQATIRSLGGPQAISYYIVKY